MLTGKIMLQAMRAQYNQFAVDPRCPLCGESPEDMPHVLVQCELLEPILKPAIAKLVSLLTEFNRPIPTSKDDWCKMILNCGIFDQNHTGTKYAMAACVEIDTSCHCYALHCEWDILINERLLIESQVIRQ